MSSYAYFAGYYDELTRNVDYGKQADYLEGRVHVREADAAFAQRVDVGSLDLLLPVATEVAVACVVHQDEDHVGTRSRIFRTSGCGQCGNCRKQCPGD